MKTKYENPLFFVGVLTFFLMFVGYDAAACGELPDVLNAKPNLQEMQLEFPNGTLVNYSCNDGYSLKNGDNAIAICIADDNETADWQLEVFSCKQTCGDLPTLSHAQFILEGKIPPFTTGDTINIQCDNGYISGGSVLKITCNLTAQGNAIWTGPEKECVAKSCAYPGDIENARSIGRVYTFPNRVTFICNEGFKMKGMSSMYCSATGNWIPSSLPSCEAVVCPLLPNPEHGRVISADRKYGSVATYECDRGHQLKGSEQRVCQNDSTWSGQLPICTGITCLDPGELENGRVLPKLEVYNSGDSVIFICNSENIGHSSKCLETGFWSNRPPYCHGSTSIVTPVTITTPNATTTTTSSTESPGHSKDNACEDPGEIPHGKKIITGITPNSSVSYSCEDGYELRGTGTLVCLSTGKWNLDKLPICVKPIPVTTIVGIVVGIICVVVLGVSTYLCYRWREHKLRGYGQKSKALTNDATDMDEIARLEKDKKPIPVTVL